MNLAVVTPWFGEELAGGAERLAFEMSKALHDRGHDVTVLTTCVKSPARPWNRNELPFGEVLIGGLRTLRFRVDRTDAERFRRVNAKLLATQRERMVPGVPLLEEAEVECFVRDNINSVDLLTHLARKGMTYDAVIFLPYCYGITLRGWRVVRDRAIVAPCLHEEAYAYLPPVAEMMRGAPGLFFNSRGEYETARRIYGPGIDPRSRITGAGIAWPELGFATGALVDGFIPEETRYVLYLGRLSDEKNVGFLVDAFREYRRMEPQSQLRLVLAGRNDASQLAATADVLEIGVVDEAQKARLLRHCRALVQPSTNESFSRAMVEAWTLGRPVLVHSGCPATATALAETQAGWKAGSAAEWRTAFLAIDRASDAHLNAVGERASSYVREQTSWPNVIARTEAGVVDVRTAREADDIVQWPKIVQVLPSAEYSSGATILALNVDALLRRHGFPATVAAHAVDPRLRAMVRPFDPALLESGARGIAYVSEKWEVLPDGCRAAATSASTVRALRQRGTEVTVVAPFVDLEAWNIEPDASLMTAWQDGCTNILAMGPVCPAGRQLEIVETFGRYLTLDFRARLLLVGGVRDAAYLVGLRERIERMHMEHRILLTGEVSRPALVACYRTARVAVTLRERFETGLSLLEAMAFDVPVCALASEDTRAILGDAGVLVTDSSRSLELAALWRVLAHDSDVRVRVLEAQRRRAAVLQPSAALAAIERVFEFGAGARA